MKAHEYWVKRSIHCEKEVYQLKMKAVESLVLLSERAISSLEMIVEHFYLRYSVSGKITQASMRKNLTADELAEVRSYFGTLQSSASVKSNAQEMYRLRARRYISRREVLLAVLRYYVVEYSNKAIQEIEKTFTEIAQYCELHGWYDLEQGIGYQIDYERMSDTQLETLTTKGYEDQSFYAKMQYTQNLTIRNLTRSILRLLIIGTSKNSLFEEIHKNFKSENQQVEKVIQTDGTSAAAQSLLHVYSAAGCTEYEIQAILDSHTSEICQAMNAKSFKVSEAEIGTNLPPFHYRCRSIILPKPPVSSGTTGAKPQSYDAWFLARVAK